MMLAVVGMKKSVFIVLYVLMGAVVTLVVYCLNQVGLHLGEDEGNQFRSFRHLIWAAPLLSLLIVVLTKLEYTGWPETPLSNLWWLTVALAFLYTAAGGILRFLAESYLT